MTWHTEPLLAWDLETTGVNVETARIVTAAVVRTEGDQRLWLADPGIDIPAEATAVHGVTTEQARLNGRRAVTVVGEIAQTLVRHMAAGTPVIAMNASYDLTVLDRELRRYGLATLDELLGRPVGPVIDPLVLDRAADKYRPGSRKLEALCAHYGIHLGEAHTAGADAQAALDVALKIAEKYPELQVAAERLHTWQVAWYERWAAEFEEYLRRKGELAGPVDRSWPVRPWAGGAS